MRWKMFSALGLALCLSTRAVAAEGPDSASDRLSDVAAGVPAPSKQNNAASKKNGQNTPEVVRPDKHSDHKAPQEVTRPEPLNARVREILGQEDPLWPSDTPSLRVKPSGAATANAILRKMGQSDDAETRRRAVEGLRLLGNGVAGPELMSALQDESPAVREAAASSLVGAPPEVAFAAVMQVLTTGSPEEIACVESVLPRLKESLKEAMLGTLMNSEEAQDRKVAAAFSLGRMRSTDALRVLVDLAWTGEPLLAAYSADALAYMGDPTTVLDLVDLLKHTDPDVRCAAVDGLGRIGGPDAVKALSELLTSDNEDRSRVRQRAVQVLARIGGADVVPVLIQAMTAPDMAVREVSGAELRRLTGMDLRSEPGLWTAWYEEELAARQQALPPEQSADVPPLVPSLPPELPPGLKPWYEQDDSDKDAGK